MRVLQIHNTYQHAGGEDQVLALEKHLLESNGIQVQCCCVDNSNISGIIKKISIALQACYSPRGKEIVAEQLRDFSPDIVHIHNFFPLLTPSIYDACIEVGVPVVQTLHNYRTICPGALLMRDGNICELCVTGSPFHAIRYSCYRGSRFGSWAVARMVDFHRKENTWRIKVDRFIALSEFAKEKFIEAGFPSQKISVKPNFCRATNAGDAIQSRRGALFVGRVSREKGIYTLIRAWEKLVIPLNVVGDGPLINFLKNNNLSYVAILGRKAPDEIIMEMQKSEFLVMPSVWYEGFPMVLVEAFSNALPVICSRLGGMAEIVEDGKTGLHFEAGNADDLAEKVRWAEVHPEEMRVMGDNARKEFEEKYTPESNYNQLMEIYKEAINERKQIAANHA